MAQQKSTIDSETSASNFLFTWLNDYKNSLAHKKHNLIETGWKKKLIIIVIIIHVVVIKKV